MGKCYLFTCPRLASQGQKSVSIRISLNLLPSYIQGSNAAHPQLRDIRKYLQFWTIPVYCNMVLILLVCTLYFYLTFPDALNTSLGMKKKASSIPSLCVPKHLFRRLGCPLQPAAIGFSVCLAPTCLCCPAHHIAHLLAKPGACSRGKASCKLYASTGELHLGACFDTFVSYSESCWCTPCLESVAWWDPG